MSLRWVHYRESTHIGRLYQLLLLTSAVLIAYYPATFAGLCTVDDVEMVSSWINSPSWSLKGIFLPGVHNGGYYRPVLALSFVFDRFLWNMDQNIMHLENIIIHVMNVLMVYWLAIQLLPLGNNEKSILPLLAGLFFGLHPVTTESVNWISGRTDLLAGTLVLLSANCLIKFKKHNHYLFLMVSFFALFLGFLTKEVALAFIPGAFVILMTCPTTVDDAVICTEGRPYHCAINKNICLTIVTFGVLALYFILRSRAILSTDFRFGMTAQIILSDPVHALFTVLSAFGFYVKKIFFPFPLNFAIVEIDPLFYELLSVPILIICMVIALKRNLIAAVFTAGVLMIVPAFPFAFGKIAWTPYAERYIYISTAFIIVAALAYGGRLIKRNESQKRVINAATAVVLLFMASATFQRSLIWADNIALMRDTVHKSPSFQSVRIDYALLLARQGAFQDARVQLTFAKESDQYKTKLLVGKMFHNPIGPWENVDFCFAYLLEREGKLTEATAAYENVFMKYQGNFAEALERIVFLYATMLPHGKDAYEKAAFRKKLHFYSEKAYHANVDPHVFYAVGKKLLALGDERGAIVYFRRAYDKLHDDDVYKNLSLILWMRLEKA